ELQLLLELGEPLLELRDELAQVTVVARRAEVLEDTSPLTGELVRALELLELSADLGRLAPVAVHRGVGHPLLRLEVRALQLVDECLETGHANRVTPVLAGELSG